MLDPARRDTEAFLDVAQELGDALQPPLRDDNYFTLSIRVMRSFKLNSWTDNPPARTTRLVSNVEAWVVEGGFEVHSNVLIAYSRYGADNALYTARRRDYLRDTAQGLKIASRTVMLDWNVVTGPSAGLFF